MTAPDKLDALVARLRAWRCDTCFSGPNTEPMQQAAAAIASLRDDLAELRAATFPPPLGPHLERMQDRAEKAEAELAAAKRRIAVLEESHAVGAMELDAAQRSPPREPTMEMQFAGSGSTSGDVNCWTVAHIWRAMYDTAPQTDDKS